LYRAFIELTYGAGSIALPFVAPANDRVFRATEQIEVEYLTVKKTKGKETE
jgi:hypothetical protein